MTVASAPTSAQARSSALRRAVRAMALVVALGVGGPTSCSLIIDLPADCTPEVCGGYACNAEGTECLFACNSDDDCAQTHACDGLGGAGACQERGCVPDGPPLSIFNDAAPGAPVRMASNAAGVMATWLDQSGQIVARPLGLDGLPTAPAAVLDDASLVPEQPHVASNGGAWAVVWEARDARNRELLRFALLDASGAPLAPATTLWRTEGDDEISVDGARVVWDPQRERWVIAWSTQRVGRGGIFMLRVREDGTRDEDGEATIPHDDGVAVVSSDDGAFDVRLLVQQATDGTVPFYDLAWRAGAIRVDVFARLIQPDDFTPGSDDVGLVDPEATDAQARDYDYVAIPDGSVGVYTANIGGNVDVWRAQLLPSRALAGERPLKIGTALTEPDEATVVSGDGAYTVGFIATLGEERAVYLARYRANGSIVGTTAEVSAALTEAPSNLSMVALPDARLLVTFASGDGRLARVLACVEP